MKLFGIVGAGGFGREVMPLVKAMMGHPNFPREDYQLVFVVENLEQPTIQNGYTVISLEEFVQRRAEQKFFNIAIANSWVRERIAQQLLLSKIAPFAIVAPNSCQLEANDIGAGAIFCPYTMITSNSTIGKFCHLNIYSYVAHDCRIGNYVTFAPKVCCNGYVWIEDHAYIGTGAILKPGTQDQPLRIGKGAVIGMGAIVTRDVPAFTTVVGNPAKELIKSKWTEQQK